MFRHENSSYDIYDKCHVYNLSAQVVTSLDREGIGGGNGRQYG